MKASKGKANPKIVNERLREKLKSSGLRPMCGKVRLTGLGFLFYSFRDSRRSLNQETNKGTVVGKAEPSAHQAAKP